MSQQNQSGLSVGCVAEGGKTGLPGHICDLFQQEMTAAFPGRNVRQAVAEARPDVLLVVEDAAPGRFVARIDHGGVTGPSLATARKGAPLDDAALSALLRGLIQTTPDL